MATGIPASMANGDGDEMLPEALTTLAAAAGTAVVQVASTDAWNEFRARVARLFARGDANRESTESRRLDETAAALRAAMPDRLQLLRVRHEAVWQTRFEEFLESLTGQEREQVAAELHALLYGGGHPRRSVSAETSGVAAGGNASISAGDGSVIGGTGNVAGGIHGGGIHVGGTSHTAAPRPYTVVPPHYTTAPQPNTATGAPIPSATPLRPAPVGQPGPTGATALGPPAGPRRRNRWVIWVAASIVVTVLAFFGVTYFAFRSFIVPIWQDIPGFGSSNPTVVNATGSPPWMIQGNGYVFTFNRVKRVKNSACTPGPMLTITGTIKRTTTFEFTDLSPEVRNQDGNPLSDAGSGLWESSPTLNQTDPITINVCAGTPPATRLKITITDFYHPNAALILQNIPVPAATS